MAIGKFGQGHEVSSRSCLINYSWSESISLRPNWFHSVTDLMYIGHWIPQKGEFYFFGKC